MSLGKRFAIIHAAIVAIPVMATFVAAFVFLYICSLLFKIKFSVDSLIDYFLVNYSLNGRIVLFTFFVAAFYLISLVFTSLMFSYKLREDVVKPVKRLKTALDKISIGDLDYELFEDGVGEIKEVTASFEKMRIKLKESLYLKQKYDDNRKMLVSSISHDLRTPLTSIKGYLQGILEGVADSKEKTDKYLNTSIKKAEQMEIMIDDLLLYSKLDLGQILFNFEWTDIGAFFDDCVEESKYEIEKNSILLEYRNLLSEARIISIDRDRFKRVISNILDNAIKYMDKQNGLVKIELRELETTKLQQEDNIKKGAATANVLIEISDNGRGISKEEISLIFDRFYRADSSRGETNGSGLGLAIARQIVEGHGGNIWAKSKTGEGTSIILSMPWKKMGKANGGF